MKLKVVKIGEDGITEKDLLIHDAEEENPGLHSMLIVDQRPRDRNALLLPAGEPAGSLSMYSSTCTSLAISPARRSRSSLGMF